jgi:hypothetical protein
MPSPGVGGYDFANAVETSGPSPILWDAHALPSVIALTGHLTDLAQLGCQPLPLEPGIAANGPEHLIEHCGTVFRVHLAGNGLEPPAALLPLDQFFEIRAIAAIRLWRGLTGRNPGPNPAALSRARLNRLILALRALDGRLDDATYREIARVLFAVADVSERGWKGHDLRDRTIRLVRFGLAMMSSGYRRLLIYPYRRRS